MSKRTNIKYAKLTEEEQESSQSTIELSDLANPHRSSEVSNAGSDSSSLMRLRQAGETRYQPLSQPSESTDYYNALLEDKSLVDSISK